MSGVSILARTKISVYILIYCWKFKNNRLSHTLIIQQLISSLPFYSNIKVLHAATLVIKRLRLYIVTIGFPPAIDKGRNL